jgi:hypothetical protein
MLIGSVSEEGNRMSSRPTEAEWLATLTKSCGDSKAAAIVAALKKAYPQKSIRTLSYLAWTPFTPDGCPTMVFDDTCRVVSDPEAEARKILLA